MRRIIAPLLLLLACGLALAGCRPSQTDSGGKGAGVVADSGNAGFDALLQQLNAFTEEMAGKVEAASDPSAGVAEAQRLLDARRPELVARIAALKLSPRLREDASARGKWLEAEVDNTDRIHRLQVKLSDASTRDPGLKARLDKLVADYDSMFGDR
ncbi:MAG: hypothetical protein QOJ76_3400 [Acidobacteriota bacterium]|jgi:hypothetical protein|nr:hypothetical protein [Acidobacteriota bacterium]